MTVTKKNCKFREKWCSHPSVSPSSSPHLLEERERIRLNGRPLPKAKFVFYFCECYSVLERSKGSRVY